VLSTAWRLASGLRSNPLGQAGCGAFALLTVVAVGLLRWPLAWIVLGLGPVAIAAAWTRLAR
jgi:chromate transporter